MNSARPNINLYDAGLRQRFDWLAPAPAVALLGAVALVVAAAAVWAQARANALAPQAEQLAQQVQAEQAALQTLAQQRSAQRADPALQAALSEAQGALQLRLSALTQLQPGSSSTNSHAATLAALARQSTDGLWLTGLTLQGTDVTLRGRALEPALIPTYVQRLNTEPALRGRTFRSLQVERPLSETGPQPTPTPAAGPVATAPPAATLSTRSTPADAGPQRAAFVEFSLTGLHNNATPAAGRADAPDRSSDPISEAADAAAPSPAAGKP